MFCLNCGAEQPAGAQFCPSCGAAAASPLKPYAGFWIRFAAYIIDSIILTAPLCIVMIPAFAVLLPMMRESSPQQPVLMLGVLFSCYATLFALMWLYFSLFESSAKQGTPGKMALGLTVTDLEGKRISFGRASARYFCKILSGVLAIGYLMIAFTQKKQGLHDMIAGCLVLKRA